MQQQASDRAEKILSEITLQIEPQIKFMEAEIKNELST
jgi:hypothetical protein